MIFVTVGTNPTMHFDRLLRPMDLLAAWIAEEMEESVIMQTGCSAYVPQHAESFTFTTSERIEELNRSARLVVSHAAAGSVITALRYQKPVIVVPRRHYLNEHIDDHQLELARALEAQRRAITVYEPTVESLRQAIQLASQHGSEGNGAKPLIRSLRSQLDAWHKGASADRREMVHPSARKS